MLDKRKKRRTYLFFFDLFVLSTRSQLPDDDLNRHDGPALDGLLKGEADGAAIEEKKNTS